MGYARSFYLERRSNGEWRTPADSASSRGWIGDWSSKSYLNQLFEGAQALFHLRPGPPAERSPASAFFAWLDGFYDYQINEYRLAWLPVEELLLECWADTRIYVATTLPIRFAHLFGNGDGPFPSEQLLREGFDRDQIVVLTQWRYHGWLTSTASTPLESWQGRQLAERNPNHLVPVSWRETLASLLGPELVGAFQRILDHGRVEDLRLLTIVS